MEVVAHGMASMNPDIAAWVMTCVHSVVDRLSIKETVIVHTLKYVCI